VADKTTPKPAEEPKKKPKKLTIIDANEEVAPPAPPEEPVKNETPDAGDTPPLADEEELAAIAEAFADIPEEAPEPKSPAKKIAVSEHVEEEPATEAPVDEPSAEEPSEVPVEDTPEESPEEPDEPAGPPEVDETPAEEEPDLADALSDESEEKPADEAAQEDTEDSADQTEEVAEEAVAEPVPEKRPLSQLTNNVPRPPKPVQDIVADIEPEKEFADQNIASAVDDIVAKESDELLEKEDAAAAAVKQAAKKPKRSLKSFFKAWWGSPAGRWGTIVGVILLLMLIIALPASRYGILNAAGVRVNASVTVISNESQQPLKNATVRLADKTATTDEDGKATFSKMRLGKADMEITKRGFASVQQSKVLGWGSNPFGQVGMTVTGTRFIFNTKDFLSGKAVTSAEAVSGDYNASADAKGKIILAVDQKDDDTEFKVTIKADGYRQEIVTIKPTDKGDRDIAMVAAKQRVFVSKRSGKLDVYKIDADGKNESVLLAGTGKERNDLAVMQQPNGDYTAVVSTRLGGKNKEGYLLSNLFVINNKTAELTTLNQSERIQLVDWSGDRIVFIAVAEGASAANPNRSRLYSYQIGQLGAKQIASANYFNDAVVFKGAIYYAPSSYAVAVSTVKFFKVNADGSGQSTLYNGEVWNIFRSDFDTLQLSVQQDWYELKSAGSPTKLASAPPNPTSRTCSSHVQPDGTPNVPTICTLLVIDG
jgi:hypothetical protein